VTNRLNTQSHLSQTSVLQTINVKILQTSLLLSLHTVIQTNHKHMGVITTLNIRHVRQNKHQHSFIDNDPRICSHYINSTYANTVISETDFGWSCSLAIIETLCTYGNCRVLQDDFLTFLTSMSVSSIIQTQTGADWAYWKWKVPTTVFQNSDCRWLDWCTAHNFVHTRSPAASNSTEDWNPLKRRGYLGATQVIAKVVRRNSAWITVAWRHQNICCNNVCLQWL